VRIPTRKKRPTVLLGLAITAATTWVACGAPPAPPVDPDYRAGIESWRAERDERLRSETGWLTVVGLHWLEPGENSFGSGPGNPIVLPEGRGPETAGSFVLGADGVTLRADAGSGITLDGETVTERELRADADGTPNMLELDDLTFYVIKRGDRFGIRVKDPRSEMLSDFTGVESFPIDPSYRVEATFVPYDPPKEVQIATVVGTVQPMLTPGRVEFTLNGEKLALEPMVDKPDDESYFFIFRDGTSGKETYGAGRYLYTEAARDGRLILDFNKAYNPPCVFTPFATCPLPPPQNRMPIRVEAGEKVYGHS
jgi:uncharacterized protein (DUF1684 family)